MFCRTFSFTGAGGDVSVTSKERYREETGCGFLGFSADRGPEDKFTGSGGWNPRAAWEEAHGGVRWEDGPYGVSLEGAGMPLRFRAAVPANGVYAVTVSIQGGKDGLRGLCLYAGRRNLVKRDIAVAPGEVFTYRYFVHVCAYIPVVGKPPVQDRSVYVSVLGKKARLSSVRVEAAEAPTLFIAGDSLVADYEALYPCNPLTNGGSWGQNLLQYFDGIAVSNQAHGGMTTNCFRDDGHWEIVCQNIRPGDVFMMEFGHNDQKRRKLKAFDQYAANLRWYICRIRERGAFPVIVTPLSRIPGRDEDGYFDLLEDYAQSCLRVGNELHVPVIDLHRYSFRLLCGMGTEVCKNYFNDTTHTNDYGALLVTKFLAEEIRRQKLEPLCSRMNGFAGEPWAPDETLRPPETLSSAEKPEKPILSTDLAELPYADCRHIRQLGVLKDAMRKGLLDPCLKFFHPFDEMPRGQFLYLFFKAAASPAKRPYQGRYCDICKYEFDAQNVQAALDADLIDASTTPDGRFRPDDGLTGGELLSFIVRSLHRPGERDLSLTECERQARGLGLVWEGYSRAGRVNRADCTAALVHMMNLSREEREALPPAGRSEGPAS